MILAVAAWLANQMVADVIETGMQALADIQVSPRVRIMLGAFELG